jgi:ABC-2 type transport system ATP-binding protein
VSETPMIEVEALTKRFGATRALDEVSLSTGTGRVLALLGPNGAGKTTLVRVLTTLLEPDSGRARVAGLYAARGPWARRRRSRARSSLLSPPQIPYLIEFPRA